LAAFNRTPRKVEEHLVAEGLQRIGIDGAESGNLGHAVAQFHRADEIGVAPGGGLA